MKELSFLKKLKKKGIIELVEFSEEMKSSYLIKAENCFKSAKILFQSQLYENSTSEAYYCMYNSLLALLLKIGIKSENHTASIILLDKLFGNKDLVKIISWAKEERIDKQYYTPASQSTSITKESAKENISTMIAFNPKIIALKNNLKSEEINKIRGAIKNV